MQEDLLRAVLAAPDDPAPRLVYADALMRAGDPRGEFIALQCAGKPEADALLEAHRAEWLRPLPHVTNAYFERGFVTAATLVCDDDPAPPLAALDREPIRSLTIVLDGAPEDSQEIDVPSKARWLVSDPRIALIRSLDLSHVDWREHAMATLLRACWSALRELHIGGVDCDAQTLFEIVAGDHELTTVGLHNAYDADVDDGIGFPMAPRRSPAVPSSPTSSTSPSTTAPTGRTTSTTTPRSRSHARPTSTRSHTCRS